METRARATVRSGQLRESAHGTGVITLGKVVPKLNDSAFLRPPVQKVHHVGTGS